MRVRTFSYFFSIILVISGCFLLYMITDLIRFQQQYEDSEWYQSEDKLRQIEADIREQHEKLEELKNNIIEWTHKKIKDSNVTSSINNIPLAKIDALNHIQQLSPCNLQTFEVSRADVQLLQLYDTITFDNLDGGAWKQGWNIEYDPQSWTPERKLKVFVVPHSHNDAGWLKTFEDYYTSKTRNILNNMAKKLLENERRKFIWAEISFFSMWYDESSSDVKNSVKKLLENGQLEIVTGGYVMNDEANSHYFSILTQLIEGHQYLLRNLDYKPKNSWSIDPFGVSPVMPYILKKMGLKNLVIQRVHYSVKKALAQSKYLEFFWRQLWDETDSTDLFTHMMPFYSYDVPHSCGPDPKICCQFDFRRLLDKGMSCPWNIPPQVITNTNVAQRAQMLLDQYRKKSQLYRTNVVLAPLGDDFRYDLSSEWDTQYQNYQKLFDYMNNNSNLNVHAQFGTLRDFFDAVHEEMSLGKFPTLTGDFFTYADRDDHYWSGYYTSRPFYKRMDRVLMSYLRSAEIIFSLAWGKSKEMWSLLVVHESGLMRRIASARQSLSLFQHHDGITGTAKDHVVKDYAKKLLRAIRDLQHVIQVSAFIILSSSGEVPNLDYNYFNLDDSRKYYYSLPEKTGLTFGDTSEPRKIVLYNSLTCNRKELVTLKVSARYAKVTNLDGNPIPSQTTPIILQSGSIDQKNYDVSFIAEVPALGLVTYFIHALHSQESSSKNTFCHIKIYNHIGDLPILKDFDHVETFRNGREFSLSNEHFSVIFNNQGLLESVKLRHSSVTYPIHLDFVKYSARPGSERSGAYLFLPDGSAALLNVTGSLVYVFDGPLASFVKVLLTEVQHTIAIYNTPGVDSFSIEINNIVDITNHSNYELAMRLSTNINNNDEFFTDLSGMQMIRRRRFNKLPIQANYYPLPSAAYIEDDATRLTLLSGQPLGVASLNPGQIEVMQDRRLNQDDNRGLGQGVLDNHPTPNIFRVLLERKDPKCKTTPPDHPAGFLSFAAYMSSHSLLYPILRLVWLEMPGKHKLASFWSPVLREPGVDIHLVTMYTFHTQSKNSLGMIMFRQQLEKCFSIPSIVTSSLNVSSGMLNISSLFPNHFGDILQESSLSFLYSGKQTKKNISQPFCPMEMIAFTFPMAISFNDSVTYY